MTKNGGLTYIGIKNEHIQVCPHCGSTGFKKNSKKYKTIKSGLAYYHHKQIRIVYPYFCRSCKQRFPHTDNLQNWLLKKFNEAREKEKL